MFERRPIFGLLIGLTICISIWRISMQEPAMLANEMNIYTTNQLQPLQQHQQHQIFTSSLESTAGNDYLRDEHHLKKHQIKNENLLIGSSSKKFVTDANLNFSKFSKLTNLNNKKTFSISNSDELQNDDIKNLIDLNNFEYLINQLPCPSKLYDKKLNDKWKYFSSIPPSDKLRELKPPLILILVHSAPQNYQKRLLIRETWGSLNTSKLRLIFLLGAVLTKTEQYQIELENNMFSDILQGNFIDNYRNMTYKHVMALKWFKYYCPNAKYLLKVDDDVFVNTPQLIEFFKEDNSFNQITNSTLTKNNYHQKYINNKNILSNNNLLFCQKQDWSRVKRTYRSKWRVSTKEYSGRYYPPYCPGYSIIYSSDVVFKLYKLAQNYKYFWIDDVHITGTIAQLANLTITSFRQFLLTKNNYENLLNNTNLIQSTTDSNIVPNNNNFRGNDEGDIINNNGDIINYIFLFTWPDINENEIKLLWKFVKQNHIKSIR